MGHKGNDNTVFPSCFLASYFCITMGNRGTQEAGVIIHKEKKKIKRPSTKNCQSPEDH